MADDIKKLMKVAEEALKAFNSLPNDDASNRDESMLCPYCLKIYGKKISRFDESHRIWDDKKKDFLRIRCGAEKEFKASLYYDNRLKQLKFETPETTHLLKLYNPNTKMLSHSFVISEYTHFCLHLKTFIRDLIWDFKCTDFDYKFLTVPDLRSLKFDGDSSNFNQLDRYKLLIFDLEEESHFNVSDVPHLSELMTHRERNFLPIWFLNKTPTVTNKHVDADLRNRIQKLPKVNLGSSEFQGKKDDFYIEETLAVTSISTPTSGDINRSITALAKKAKNKKGK
jgi:hypothetical protein